MLICVVYLHYHFHGDFQAHFSVDFNGVDKFFRTKDLYLLYTLYISATTFIQLRTHYAVACQL